jgi:chemotaxis protein MotB
MPEQSKRAFTPLTWLLLLVVIGLIALLWWYGGALRQDLTNQRAKTAQHAQQLMEAKANLDSAARTEKTLHDEIQGLADKLEAAHQTNLGLKHDIEALQQQHADALAGERRKAADAYAELQGRFDGANEQIAALGSEIEGLKQAQADATARHGAELAAAKEDAQTKLKSAEDQFNERTARLRTAFEGTDPERAALFADLDKRVQSDLATIADLETTKGDLSDQLAAAKTAIEQRGQALAETTKQLESTQEQLTQARGETAQLQTQYDAAMDKATMDLAALQAKHDAAVAKAAQEKSDLQAKHAAAMDQAAKDRADLEASHAAALDQASKQHAALKATHAAALEQAAKDRADLQAAHTAAMEQAAQDAAALKARFEGDLATANAAHAEEMDQANGRIQALSASLAAETAALADLKTEHGKVVAELKADLADTEQSLAGVRSDLQATEHAATEQKAALEQQIAQAQGRISTLEDTLTAERKQQAAALVAADLAHAEAMASQHKLYMQVSELGGHETANGLLLSLAEADLRFPISKATLPAGDLPSLDRIAALLTQFPALRARIEGHTDAAGREETNLALSQARADAIKQALVERGVAAERLEAVGFGETRPIADNATKAGSRQNRRVEVYIIEAAR